MEALQLCEVPLPTAGREEQDRHSEDPLLGIKPNPRHRRFGRVEIRFVGLRLLVVDDLEGNPSETAYRKIAKRSISSSLTGGETTAAG